MKNLKKMFGLNLIFSITILAAAFAVSHLFGSWFGYPRGTDALFHIFKSEYILGNWPNHHWWHVWAGGMPLLLYYPPLPHYFFALAKLATGASFEWLLTASAALSCGLISFTLYLLVFRLTKNRFFALIGSLLYLTCPSSWAMALYSGVYIRALAMPFFVFGLYFSLLFWQEYETGSFNKRLFALTSLFMGLTILTHQYIALVGYATFAFLTFFIIRGKFLDKTVTFARIILASLFLSASFWLPLLKFFPKSPTISWLSPSAKQPVPWENLVPLPNLQSNLLSPTRSYDNFTRLTPFLLPLAIFLTILAFLFKFRRLKKDNFLVRILEFSGWMILFWLVYSTGNLLRFAKTLPLINTAYSFLGTRGATYFLPIFLSVAIGLLLSFLLTKKKLAEFVIFGFLITALAFFMKEQSRGILNYLQSEDWPTQIEARDFSFLAPTLVEKLENLQEKNFRLGLGAKTETALNLSSTIPALPQTGHYFAPGVANFELYYYLEQTLWRQEKNENETRFLLDWWGIKPIFASPQIEKFRNTNFDLTESKDGLNLYTYQNPSPLLSPSQALAILVIGSQKSYQGSFFRSLAIGNLGSNWFIPIPEKATVEGYSWRDLSSFDLVFLYDYQIRNPLPWTAKILNDYVKNGGHLIIESSRDIEANQSLPDPFPIKKVSPSERIGNWNFKIEAENPYLDQADLASFSPPKYEGEAWGISEGVEIKDWAKTILTSDGKPVLVEGNLGKGKVLWSGINLPFHITHHSSSQEAQLLKKILLGPNFTPHLDLPKFEVEFINPQERILYLEDEARGVLFKENYFPNWQARAKTANNKTVKLKIYSAGPGFMFAYLPEGTKEVVFFYRRSWVERIADLISLVTFSWLLLSLLTSTKLRRGRSPVPRCQPTRLPRRLRP